MPPVPWVQSVFTILILTNLHSATVLGEVLALVPPFLWGIEPVCTGVEAACTGVSTVSGAGLLPLNPGSTI